MNALYLGSVRSMQSAPFIDCYKVGFFSCIIHRYDPKANVFFRCRRIVERCIYTDQKAWIPKRGATIKPSNKERESMNQTKNMSKKIK